MMSVYEKQFENDKQNFFQSIQNSRHRESRKSEEISTATVKPNEKITSQTAEKFLPEIVGWRRAEAEDENPIEQLQTLTGDVADLLYRTKSIVELIETCYFPVVQFDSKGNLVSFTALDSHPNIPSTPFWNDCLSTNYEIKGVHPGNALFIHYMVWQPEQEDKFLPLLLETSFAEFVHLKYIIIIKPPKTDVPDFYGDYFFPVLPLNLGALENNSIQLLLLCLRSSIIHPMNIRIAFEEEMDLIRDVVNSSKQKTKGLFNLDLFNLTHQEDKKTLICELERKLAGVMILNVKIDLDFLNEMFELGPFNGLRKKESENGAKPEILLVPEKETEKESRSTNLLMSSKLLLSPMNWELSFSKLKPQESSSVLKQSTSCTSSDSHLSQFSFIQLSSILDLKRSNELLEILSNKKSELLYKMEDLNVKIRTSESTVTHFCPPKYHGQSNAFLIDFFAIDCNNIDEKLCSFDFLEAAFKLVPDREYCILLIPTNSLPCALLDSFVRVTPRPLTSVNKELYLCHKNSLSIISMSVRSAEKDDLVDIKDFLKYVDKGDTVYHDILHNCFNENKNFKSFILTLDEKIVGVSLINPEDSVGYFHMYFEVADFACTEMCGAESRSVIKHLVVNPKYHNHARFFVRELMRLMDATCVYYINNMPWKKRSNLSTVLGEFAPIKPKKKAEFQFTDGKASKNPFGLYILNPRLCGFHKIHINIVIVVVGASRTALSFFENLIFGPWSSFYNFNNLICVSPHGLDTDEEEEDIQDFMFPIRDNLSRNYKSMLSLDTYVSVIHGVMTKINRSEKYIVVNNKSTVKYDYLVLTCGLQYLLPNPEFLGNNKNQKEDTCKKNFKSSLARFLRRSAESKSTHVPKQLNNMFIINTYRDAKNALHTLKFLMQKIKKDGKKIIIYGHDLHVFLTINTMLKLGIPGEFIVFVEPFPSRTNTFTLFNDYSVDQAVLGGVKDCKVSYYTDYFLYDWSVSAEDYITSIKFHSKRQQLVIPCLAFFPFLEKLVSDVTFNVCNDAGLLYDGKLVINHNFRTNDSHIYAAGTFTKYARRYYANEYNHQHYNSREVGQKLAEIIRRKIDPMSRDKTEEQSDLVPQLTAPVFFYCQMPGEFNLFILRKPGRELDLETAYNIYDYGEVMTTGDCTADSGAGYFRLHLDSEGFVESITCYTKDEIDYVNLSSLYGLHERLLNNLLLRYDMALIPDFFKYFREPWALSLFHSKFKVLRDFNHEAFLQEIFDDKNFHDRVVEELETNNWKTLDDTVRQQLELYYLNSNIKEDIRCNLIKFLEVHKKDLPVYCTPAILKILYKKNRKL